MEHAFKKICQTILLKNKEKVLILRLSHNKEWELPGGRMDKGEEWLEGLKREVEEETGIKEFEVTDFIEVDPGPTRVIHNTEPSLLERPREQR